MAVAAGPLVRWFYGTDGYSENTTVCCLVKWKKPKKTEKLVGSHSNFKAHRNPTKRIKMTHEEDWKTTLAA